MKFDKKQKTEMTSVGQDVRDPDVRDTSAPGVSLKECEDGSFYLMVGEENSEEDARRLKEAFGVTQPQMFEGFLHQIVNTAVNRHGPVEHNFRFAVGFVKSIAPENEVEAALAAQMAAVHIAAMDSARRFSQAENLQQRDSAERAMNKLMRTFTTQMEALKRYRSKAQQVVRVERVTIEEGGQAIVGDVHHRGEG